MPETIPNKKIGGALETSRSNNFNFLRVVFATLVLLSHSYELVDGDRSRELLTSIFGTLSFGEFAVDGFFLLSGYLIVQSWENDPNPISFLAKRILRIYPAFIVASLACALVFGPMGSMPDTYFSQLDTEKLVISTLRLAGPIVPAVFEGQPYPSINGAMWTIKYEFACYLSVLLLGIVGFVKRSRGWLTIATVLLLTFLLANYYQTLGLSTATLHQAKLFESPALRLAMFFFAGGAYYLLRESIAFRPRTAIISSLVLLIAMFSPDSAEFALATFGAYLLFYFAFSSAPALKIFQTIPDVSYGLYLYGWPIQKLILWFFPNTPPEIVFLMSAFIGVLAGLLSWFAIEKPALALKSKFLNKAKNRWTSPRSNV